MTNARKAAALVVALGPERSAPLLRSLREDEVQALAAEIAALGTVDATLAAGTLREAAQQVVGRALAHEGGMDFASDLLQRVLGAERAAAVIDDIDPGRRPFAWLGTADPELAAKALAPEPPASVALALAHLDPARAGRILTHLPGEVQGEVALRIAALEYVHHEVVAEVDADFERRLVPLLVPAVTPVSGLSLIVDMLNNASREVEREVVAALEQRDPELAGRVRDAMFVFEDIGRLDDRAIQQVLKSVDTRDLATAMKTAPDDVRDAVLRNLSERARENLLEEIEYLQNVRASEAHEARTRIVRIIRSLEDDGTIEISRGGDDDVVA